MSTSIALCWNDNTLQYVVAQDGQILAVGNDALEADMPPTVVGQRVQDVLKPYSPGRAKIVVAMQRGQLEWQHLALPPCPADELPDMVRMQADYEFQTSEADLGFDYLPLAGDEHTPQAVLTVAVEQKKLQTIREVCQAANLNPDRLIPLAAGWIALAKQAAEQTDAKTNIYVAPLAEESTIWATRGQQLVLLRQYQLKLSKNPADLASAVGSELRRTMLSLSQHSAGTTPAVSLVGQQSEQLKGVAHLLDEQLDANVQYQEIVAQHVSLATEDLSASFTLPLAGLALGENSGLKPPIDLLNPRRRPKAEKDIRRYSLYAIAGALLVAFLAWSGYDKLQSPLRQAAKDQTELAKLEKSLEEFAAYEEQAAEIRDWSQEVPNLLMHLRKVSQSIRPQPLAADDFSTDQDVVIESFDLSKRVLTIDAFARNNRAVQPLESRLRAAAYRPKRGQTDSSQTVKGYPWHFKSTVEITTDADTTTPPATEESS